MPDPAPSRRSSPLVELLEADKPVFSLWVNYYEPCRRRSGGI